MQREKFLNPLSEMQREEIKKLENAIRKVKELDERIKMFDEPKIKEIVLEVARRKNHNNRRRDN